ncbi:5-(carboxyamino)imidazole ribonucleotide mutase [Aliikangiella coralliicola]|uniref:N5-carboxyaminoimidazole ribonucleotide mutase n=1 Tax=Aliikangiella coralliicola TaxID=2592383 RepID=A0A545U4K6_9GAMM|nr:5-(carboxyamino)imidazole ribonucleotide mutase [Aliikangiella coralliicola]TQV84333.1 5-(carboxyamino)imidazole ribonucleotide mutase [Aliikangiella coralliicola]
MQKIEVSQKPVVSIVMGSQSDWPTMKEAANLLNQFEIPFETRVVSAHRTPDRLFDFAGSAVDNGLQIIIAGAGGAAHLPGMVASLTPLPVIAIPVESKALKGMDSLLSIVQMPKGVCVATQAIGSSGAYNGGLMAAQILALNDPEIRSRLVEWRAHQTNNVPTEVE